MSSKRNLRKKSCGKKAKHRDRGAAMNHIISVRRAGRVHGWLEVYRCRFCRFFHVGHRKRG